MANKKIPLRKCVACNEMKEKKEMIRVINATGRKNGRGAYICADPGCLRLARKNKGLERSLKTAIPQEVYESLEKEMSTLA